MKQLVRVILRLTVAMGMTGLLALSSPAPAGPPAPRSVPEVVYLWPGAPPGGALAKTPERTFEQHVDWKDQLVTISVSDPTMTVIRPLPGKGNGTAMVVAPGGGFMSLVWDLEGTEIADWLTARGVTVFLLKYRVSLPGPNEMKLGATAASAAGIEEKRSRGVADAAQAIFLIRQGAERWGIDPKRVGMMGFSAGAMITMGTVLEGDAARRPDFAAPIYGAARLDNFQVPTDAPPLFIVHAQNDPLIPATASTAIFDAWQKAKRPAELHIYTQGGHGFGMRAQGLPVDRWPSDFEAWLASRELIKSLAPQAHSAVHAKRQSGQVAAQPTRYSTTTTEVRFLLSNPATLAILEKHTPGLATSAQIAAAGSLTLKEIQTFAPDVVTDQKLDAIETDLGGL